MKIFLLILAILLVLILIGLAFLLIRPLQLLIDSENGLYWAGWNRWLYISLADERGIWGIRVKLLFWKKLYSFDRILFSGKASERKKKKTKRKQRAFTLAKARKIISSIKINELICIIDTDDVIWNARLYPVASLIKTVTGHPVRINFLGRNLIKVKARARLFNILKAGYL